MFKKLVAVFVMVGLILGSVSFFKGEEVKAEQVQKEDLQTMLLNGKENLELVKSEKLAEYGIGKKLDREIKMKSVKDLGETFKKAKFNKPELEATITTSKDKRYVTVNYVLTDTKTKKYTYVNHTVDTKKQKVLYKAEMLKNEKKSLAKAESKIAKQFNLNKEQLKTKVYKGQSPVKFEFNEKGELAYVYDSLHIQPKKKTSPIVTVSNSKPTLNKTTYKVKVSKSEFK